MAVLVEGRSKSDVARELRLSRRWVITLVQRHLAEGEAGVHPRSRQPRTQPQSTTAAREEESVAPRKEFDRDGHEGARPPSPRT